MSNSSRSSMFMQGFKCRDIKNKTRISASLLAADVEVSGMISCPVDVARGVLIKLCETKSCAIERSTTQIIFNV
jgi:hypothetical protein